MSALEDELAFQLDSAGIRYEREYKAIPDRRFRWDFLIPMANSRSILVEVQGMIHVAHTGHTSGGGIKRDCEKARLAALKGYIPLPFTADEVHDGTALETIRKAVEGA